MTDFFQKKQLYESNEERTIIYLTFSPLFFPNYAISSQSFANLKKGYVWLWPQLFL